MIAVAIDGPSGVGKSSVSQEVAKKLGFFHLDTGALYRAIAYYAVKNEIFSGFSANELKKIDIKVEFKDNSQSTFLNGENVTELLRNEEIAKIASKISKEKLIRNFLIVTQRNIAKKNNVIMDGRDIGTVVLPQANLKIFLTARPEVRAQRRFLELKESGNKSIIFNDVLKEIVERDNEDSRRKVAPLKVAEDAVFLDSSNMNFNETVLKIINLVKGIL